MLLSNLENVVLGPQDHARFGRSLLVRPTLETSRLHRFPSQAVVVTSAARKLIALNKAGDRLQSLVVQADDGQPDPTRHPEFQEISHNLRELLNKWFPKAQLCLVSTAPDLSRMPVRHAILGYDQPILRLDAGTQKTFSALTGADPKQFKSLLERLVRLDKGRLIVHTRFVRGEVDNSKDNEVRAWLKNLGDIRPAGVHISTVAKPRKNSIPKSRMSQIATLVTEKIGVPVEVCEE